MKLQATFDLSATPLFAGMMNDEIECVLSCSHARIKEYEKNVTIFGQIDPPKALYVLLSGSIEICRNSAAGKRYIITTMDEPGVFGEVFVFLEDVEYAYYVVSTSSCVVLEIPKEFFYRSCDHACHKHDKVTQNLLSILASKAFFLNNKVQLLTSGSLRKKIARYLLDQYKGNAIHLSMNREQFADYLNVTRPSLSRELVNMKADGLIDYKGQVFYILNETSLMEED